MSIKTGVEVKPNAGSILPEIKHKAAEKDMNAVLINNKVAHYHEHLSLLREAQMRVTKEKLFAKVHSFSKMMCQQQVLSSSGVTGPTVPSRERHHLVSTKFNRSKVQHFALNREFSCTQTSSQGISCFSQIPFQPQTVAWCCTLPVGHCLLPALQAAKIITMSLAIPKHLQWQWEGAAS